MCLWDTLHITTYINKCNWNIDNKNKLNEIVTKTKTTTKTILTEQSILINNIESNALEIIENIFFNLSVENVLFMLNSPNNANQYKNKPHLKKMKNMFFLCQEKKDN